MRTELEAIYSIRTDDGVNIHVRNRGLVCDGKNADGTPYYYFKAAPQFEAPKDSRYAGMGERLQRHRFERMESKVKLIRWK